MFSGSSNSSARSQRSDQVEIDLRDHDNVVVVIDDHHVDDLRSALENRPSPPAGLVVSADLLDDVRRDAPHAFDMVEQVRVLEAHEINGEDDSAGTGVIAPTPIDLFESPLPRVQRGLKRVLDITAASIAGLLVLPIAAAAAAAIKLDSRGPVLFRQVRVGQDGRRFTVLKLRTMKTDNDDSEHRAYVARLIAGEAEQHGGTFKLTADPRVTRIGSFLRRSSIDELPQLWNVIRGDMSLVGPRPPLPHEVALYDADAWQRLRVQPGITGLWQVSGRCNLTFDEMISLDVEYWKNWHIGQDLKILAKTPVVVLSGSGAA